MHVFKKLKKLIKFKHKTKLVATSLLFSKYINFFNLCYLQKQSYRLFKMPFTAGMLKKVLRTFKLTWKEKIPKEKNWIGRVTSWENGSRKWSAVSTSTRKLATASPKFTQLPGNSRLWLTGFDQESSLLMTKSSTWPEFVVYVFHIKHTY